MLELECIVRGRVQGVMFRDFVQRHARGLRLRGTVQNRGDGAVHVFAVGEEETLQKLLRRISRGPLLSRVEIISVLWQKPARIYEGFTIVYD